MWIQVFSFQLPVLRLRSDLPKGENLSLYKLQRERYVAMKVLIERKSTASSHYLNLPDHVELLRQWSVEVNCVELGSVSDEVGME